MVKVSNLSYSYEKENAVLENASFFIEEPGVYSIIGMNGSGKSTLLKLIGGLIPPGRNRVFIDSCDVSKKSYKELSSMRSYLPQNVFLPVDFRAYDFVKYGAYSKMDMFSRLCPEEENIVLSMMEKTGTIRLKNRMTSTLSAGEMQKLHIAKALVQGGNVLLMDEPVSTIDVSFRKRFIEILKSLRKDKIVLLVTHDLHLAFNYSKRVIGLKDKKILFDCAPEEAAPKAGMIYGVRVSFIKHNEKFIFTDEEES